MHYPKLEANQNFYESKIGFSVLASAVLISLLKKQRDAVGLSVFSDNYEYYSPEKGSDSHHRMLLHKLEDFLEHPKQSKATVTITFFHQVAEKIHRRSMIVIFSDMFQDGDQEALLNALQHLKHNKHKVVLFHVIDYERELNFNFDTTPRKFIDVESGEVVNLFAENAKDEYEKMVQEYFRNLSMVCAQNKIKYVPVNVGANFDKILTTYLAEKQMFG